MSQILMLPNGQLVSASPSSSSQSTLNQQLSPLPSSTITGIQTQPQMQNQDLMSTGSTSFQFVTPTPTPQYVQNVNGQLFPVGFNQYATPTFAQMPMQIQSQPQLVLATGPNGQQQLIQLPQQDMNQMNVMNPLGQFNQMTQMIQVAPQPQLIQTAQGTFVQNVNSTFMQPGSFQLGGIRSIGQPIQLQNGLNNLMQLAPSPAPQQTATSTQVVINTANGQIIGSIAQPQLQPSFQLMSTQPAIDTTQFLTNSNNNFNLTNQFMTTGESIVEQSEPKVPAITSPTITPSPSTVRHVQHVILKAQKELESMKTTKQVATVTTRNDLKQVKGSSNKSTSMSMSNFKSKVTSQPVKAKETVSIPEISTPSPFAPSIPSTPSLPPSPDMDIALPHTPLGSSSISPGSKSTTENQTDFTSCMTEDTSSSCSLPSPSPSSSNTPSPHPVPSRSPPPNPDVESPSQTSESTPNSSLSMKEEDGSDGDDDVGEEEGRMNPGIKRKVPFISDSPRSSPNPLRGKVSASSGPVISNHIPAVTSGTITFSSASSTCSNSCSSPSPSPQSESPPSPCFSSSSHHPRPGEPVPSRSPSVSSVLSTTSGPPSSSSMPTLTQGRPPSSATSSCSFSSASPLPPPLLTSCSNRGINQPQSFNLQSSSSTTFSFSSSCPPVPPIETAREPDSLKFNEDHGVQSADSPSLNTIANTLATSSIRFVDGVDLEQVRTFAGTFKLRRIQLGFTQTQVGWSLSESQGPSYSQSAICRFEKLEITPKSAQKIMPVLQDWLMDAESKCNQMELTLNGPLPVTPASLDGNKKRKRRTSFAPGALDQLNHFFNHTSHHPDSQQMTELSDLVKYDREVVRVWFCNKRQALKCHSMRRTYPTSSSNSTAPSVEGEEAVSSFLGPNNDNCVPLNVNKKEPSG